MIFIKNVVDKEKRSSLLKALTISMMRWPHTKHFSAVCWKPEYCGWNQTRRLSCWVLLFWILLHWLTLQSQAMLHTFCMKTCFNLVFIYRGNCLLNEISYALFTSISLFLNSAWITIKNNSYLSHTECKCSLKKAVTVSLTLAHFGWLHLLMVHLHQSKNRMSTT